MGVVSKTSWKIHFICNYLHMWMAELENHVGTFCLTEKQAGLMLCSGVSSKAGEQSGCNLPILFPISQSILWEKEKIKPGVPFCFLHVCHGSFHCHQRTFIKAFSTLQQNLREKKNNCISLTIHSQFWLQQIPSASIFSEHQWNMQTVRNFNLQLVL